MSVKWFFICKPLQCMQQAIDYEALLCHTTVLNLVHYKIVSRNEHWTLAQQCNVLTVRSPRDQCVHVISHQCQVISVYALHIPYLLLLLLQLSLSLLLLLVLHYHCYYMVAVIVIILTIFTGTVFLFYLINCYDLFISLFLVVL